MVQWLNKKIAFSLLLLCSAFTFFSQDLPDDVPSEHKSYKDQGEFNKFHKRAKTVAAWQINQLKEGALVVRLKTNEKIIDALIAQGKTDLALIKKAETFMINKNIVMAYTQNFTFCKVYFMYSHSSDSLLKGVRSGIFLDYDLAVDKKIELRENFYLLAERDYAYNSSIGFVREDSARIVKETGNPVREMGVVIKNKYGHQLKNPFPYYVKDKTFADYLFPYYTLVLKNESQFVWVNDDNPTERSQLDKLYPEAKQRIVVNLKKHFVYKNIANIITQLNDNFLEYYQSRPAPEVKKLSTSITAYLY